MFRRSRTKELAAFIQEHDQDDGSRYSPYDSETDKIALSRLRICVFILLVFCPLLFLFNVVNYGNEYFQSSFHIHLYCEAILFAFFCVSFVSQFKRNSYSFAFLLALLLGAYALLRKLYEGASWEETLATFSIFIILLGFLMPWGGLSIAGICIPLYLFYPLGLALDQPLELADKFALRSNLYLAFMISITIIAGSIHESVRRKEFNLKQKLEGENTKLHDYQLRLERAYQRMEKLALLDQLTGAYNRIHLTQWLKEDVYNNSDCKKMFSLIMFDIDHFKDVNDIGGHQRGDDTLQKVTEIAKQKITPDAMIFRYGGDEFCIILPGLDLMRALRTADNIRYAVEQHPELFINKSGAESVHLTLSLGVMTHYVTGSIDADYLIRWVDAALMESKRQGKNCITVFDSEERSIISAVDWLAKSKESES